MNQTKPEVELWTAVSLTGNLILTLFLAALVRFLLVLPLFSKSLVSWGSGISAGATREAGRIVESLRSSSSSAATKREDEVFRSVRPRLPPPRMVAIAGVVLTTIPIAGQHSIQPLNAQRRKRLTAPVLRLETRSMRPARQQLLHERFLIDLARAPVSLAQHAVVPSTTNLPALVLRPAPVFALLFPHRLTLTPCPAPGYWCLGPATLSLGVMSRGADRCSSNRSGVRFLRGSVLGVLHDEAGQHLGFCAWVQVYW
jgi:hypothetical protein